MFTSQVIQLLCSATSGLTGICAQGDWKRAISIRSELFTIGTASMIIIGAVIMAMNKLFITLWVGPKFFGGETLTFLLLLSSIGKLVYQIDSIMMAGSFETNVKQVAISLFIFGSFTVITGLCLLKLFGVSGMVIAIICGYLLQWGYYQIIIHKQTRVSFTILFTPFIKLIVSAVPVFICTTLISEFFKAKTWYGFSIQTISILLLAFAYSWFFVLGSHERQLFVLRLKSFVVVN